MNKIASVIIKASNVFSINNVNTTTKTKFRILNANKCIFAILSLSSKNNFSIIKENIVCIKS